MKPRQEDQHARYSPKGGKGGVGKTEVALALTSWYRARGIEPTLLDFDVENSNKGGFQSFHPEARKLDLHQEGSLDAFFNAFDSDAPVVLADLAGGASNVAKTWFEDAAGYAIEMNVQFTAVGVTTNDAGSVQSVLKWAGHLQDSVDYLIVLNEMRSPRSKFNYWNDAPKVAEFVEAMNPSVMTMMARIEEFQAELRNHACTLDDIIQEKGRCGVFSLHPQHRESEDLPAEPLRRLRCSSGHPPAGRSAGDSRTSTRIAACQTPQR